MNTIFDAITITIFAGLVVLFLQRSMGDAVDHSDDPMWKYLVAAVGCAVSNYAGNEISPIAGALGILVTLAFIVWELRPLPNFPPR